MRTNEPSAASNSLRVSLPVRPAEPGSSPTVDGSRVECIRNAVSTGKTISGLLANTLRQSTLANDEESNIHQLVARAEELHNYQSPVEFTIGLVGDSGVGKSSLINSLLDEEKIAKTAGAGSACTTVVTEYRKKRETDAAAYTAEIECMNDGEIEDLLRQCVVDYRRYHLLEPGSVDGPVEEQLRRKAQVAWNILETAFGDRPPFQIRFQSRDVDIDDIHRVVLGWKNEIVWPANFNTQRIVITTANGDDCVLQINRYSGGRIWPFIKVVRIYLGAPVLRNGVVLVDLPGFRDVNSARVRITETRLHQCDEIFIVADIGRAATNVGVEDLIVRQVGRNFDGLRRSQGVAIICTKSEDFGQEAEILRDVSHTDEFNPRTVQNLKNQIEESEEDGRLEMNLRAKYFLSVEYKLEHGLTESRRNHLFISARNRHVKLRLERHYEAHAITRRIEVFCVSNTLYREACDLRARVEQAMQTRRRSLNIIDRSLAAEQQLASSGICELRDFCEGIPRSSQIAETRHFLDTKLVALLEQTEMWLTASVAGVAANRQDAPGFVGELQAELQANFNESLDTTNGELSDVKLEMLQRPLTRGRSRWEREALSAVRRLERWDVRSLMAYWNNDGAHDTRAQPDTDWNADIIRAMVGDFQPSEDLFNSRSQVLFDSLNNSFREGLSGLLASLGDLREVEAFRQTFPRRRRNLYYDVNNVTTSFSEELQIIFHDLFKTHGTSYVMRHMLPMYSEVQSGSGTKNRILTRLDLQVRGDRNNAGVFKAIRDLFISEINSLLEETNEQLQRAIEKCGEDIMSDLELLRGEDTPGVEQDGVLETMFTVLGEARTNRDEAVRVFEAGIVEPVVV
ncbi:uncharacterized protein BP5553_01548 [Venustampulla echinocandica]|uniref:P-loop containing nucleoside triphosphate hydrolase n=1 Tax=Venustampulla echinocandica TaxID=2656787 RepID=A0A370U1B1_9HELO|nr:uncharacterized protein BP5553_01548 [Venustampulla echinocandica]RDL41569.1 hypothetical protein BP5553_01548 [Venustampulla echinocandica]